MAGLTNLGLIVFAFSVTSLLLLRVWKQTTRANTPVRSGSISSMTAAANDLHEREDSRQQTIELGVRIVVSLVVLAAALFVILSKRYDGDQQKWAFGAIGTILGYWLKT